MEHQGMPGNATGTPRECQKYYKQGEKAQKGPGVPYSKRCVLEGIKKKEGNRPHYLRHMDQLNRLTSTLSILLSDSEIANPYMPVLKKHLTEEQRVYLPLIQELLRYLTVLYRHSRVEIKTNYYESSREDVVAVLGLLSVQLNPLSSISRSSYYAYINLLESGVTTFRRREAMQITGYSRSHIQRLLQELYDHNLVDKKREKNRYRYKIIRCEIIKNDK